MPSRLIQIKKQEDLENKISKGKALEAPQVLFSEKRFLAHRIQEVLREEKEEKSFCVIL